MKRFNIILILSLTAAWVPLSFAATKQGVTSAPQPTTCLVGSFSKTGDSYWSNVSLKITNQCGQSVDVRNTTITFNSSENLNTSFWGAFGSVAYPDNALKITSQPNGTGYLSSLTFHVPDGDQYWKPNSQLANGQSIVLEYGVPKAGYEENSIKVYVNGQAVQTGNIALTVSSSQPTDVATNPVIDIMDADGKLVQKATIAWGAQQNLSLAPGKYSIHPETITVSDTTSYQGSATPVEVTVQNGKTVSTSVSYARVVQNGQLKIAVQKLPDQLSGYATQPTVTLTSAKGSVLTVPVQWGNTSLVSHLADSTQYTFSSSPIDYNGTKCTANFNPASLVSSEKSPQTAQLTYACSTIKQENVNVNVSGLSSDTHSIDVTFTPSNGSANVTKTITVTNGAGSDQVKLTDGVIYNISATSVTGYSASFNPSTITVDANTSVSITYQKLADVKGRVIGYLPGWFGNISPSDLSTSPYSAEKLSAAGYTHVLVAFGLFSTTKPGEIATGAFDCAGCVTKEYVDSLHAKGIKVLLSLGGASTGIPNTSVDFHQVLSGQNPDTFIATFVQSVKTIMNQYHFDGIDIDIEHGLGPKTPGSKTEFVTPVAGSDIDVMARILKQLHADNPNILISMAPQTANISPNPNAFDGTWGNYSSLIMQTHDVISWVGIQLYNTGCTNGIDSVCYANTGNSPDYSVAMAVDLLENWPTKNATTGQATGYMPYTAYLKPDQVVLGYPAPNAQGISDGAPATNTTHIKHAIQCLKTGSTGCSQYKPPRGYSSIGGVFEWSLQYDQGNQYKFASDLAACVISGSCN